MAYMNLEPAAKSKLAVLLESLICVAGIVVFAVFSHDRPFPFILSFAGLVIAAVIININARTLKDLRQLFGFNRITGTTIIFIIISLVFGILIAVVFRRYRHDLPMPGRLTYFVIPALLIGATEELVFRGFIQGHTRRIGVMVSIVFATLAHALYKCSFILAHQSGYETDILFLLKWTIFGGFIFSLIKEYSNNIVAPIAGHAIFDLLVYGDFVSAPWWVWS
jgi:membrane protease YdiL (CAAX protease family)